MNRGRMLALACLALAVTVVAWPPLVVGNHVVPAPVSFAVIALAGVHALRRTSRTWRPAAAAAAAALAILVGLVLQQAVTHSTVLPGPPGTCTIVAVETAFLFAGSGSLGTVHGPVGVARMQSDYTADDGGTPVQSGNYTVSWDGEAAVVKLHGSGTDPVFPGLHEVTC